MPRYHSSAKVIFVAMYSGDMQVDKRACLLASCACFTGCYSSHQAPPCPRSTSMTWVKAIQRAIFHHT